MWVKHNPNTFSNIPIHYFLTPGQERLSTNFSTCIGIDEKLQSNNIWQLSVVILKTKLWKDLNGFWKTEKRNHLSQTIRQRCIWNMILHIPKQWCLYVQLTFFSPPYFNSLLLVSWVNNNFTERGYFIISQTNLNFWSWLLAYSTHVY